MKANLNKLTVVGALVIFALLPALARGETAVQAWVQLYNGPGNSHDGVYAVAVDGSNNVIVLGKSEAQDNTDSELVTIKYSSAGVPLWTNCYSESGKYSNSASAVAVDGSNNVIVTGNSHGDGSGSDFATIKYSSAGVPLWTNRYNEPTGSSVCGMAMDGSGNVIATGSSIGSDYYSDYLTIKYSSAGVPLLTNCYSGPENGDQVTEAVAVDASNNVIVTGESTGSGGDSDCVTIKYSSAGVPLWTNRYNGPADGDDSARAVAVDASNNVIVMGWVGLSNWDYLTIKYSSAGVPLWTNLYNGPADGDDHAFAMAVDGSNNVIVTGESLTKFTYYHRIYKDYATIKYSSAGVPLWTNYYNGPANDSDSACAVAVDGKNNVIVTGQSVRSDGLYETPTIKYSSAGVPLWTNYYYLNGFTARVVAVDGSGNVIVTGDSWNGTNPDFATVKYVSVAWPPAITGLSRTNGAFQLRVDDVLQPGTLVIEASTDLAGWAPVFTNTTPTNVLFYTDPDAGNNPRRFYRAFQFP